MKVHRGLEVSLTLTATLLLSAGVCVVPSSAVASVVGVSTIVAPPPPERSLTEAEAVARAEETGQPTVVGSLTTPTQIVRAVPGQGLVAEISPGPARVRESDGWHEIDASLEPDGAGRLVPVTAPAEFTITADGTGPLAELAGPSGERIALSWPEEYGDLPVPSVDGNLATFAGVWGGQVDLVVGASTAGFQTYLVLHDSAAAELPQVGDFYFDLTASGVDVAVDAGGGLEATNGTGEVVFVSRRPEQWDAGDVAGESSGTKGSKSSSSATAGEPDAPSAEEIRLLVERPDGARSAEMSMSLKTDGGSAASKEGASVTASESGEAVAQLHVRPDMSMLSAEETTFPVVLDPNLTRPDLGKEWGMYWSDGQHWYGDVALGRAGYDGWSSAPKKTRSFYKFDIASLAGTQIQSATFLHKQFHSPEHTCNTTGAGIEVWTVKAFGSGTRWPGPAKIDYQSTNYKARGHRESCFTDYENEWNVKSGLVSDLSHGYNRMRLGMFAKDEGNKYSWRKYGASDGAYPKLLVTYNRKPALTADRWAGNSTTDHHVWYGDAGWVRTRTPVLSSKPTDPDSDQVRSRFQVRNSAGTEVVDRKTALHPSGTAEYITLTSSEIPADGTYTWRASAIDEHGFESAFSSWTTMKVDTIKPPAPTITAPRLASYGTGVSLTVDAQGTHSGDVRYYRYGFLTSATPSTKGPTSLGAAVSVTRTGHMGPDWITATASDIAGNTSAKAVAKFKVMGASTSHQWRLDGNGNDEKTDSTAPLATVGAPGWVSGHDHDYDPVGSGTTVWAAGDKALSLNGTSQYAKTNGENANVINPDKGFALSAWVKLDPATVDTGAYTVASLGLPDTSAKKAALEYRAQRWKFAVRTGSGSTDSWMSVNGPTGAIERYAGKWVHLVGVYEKVPSQLRIYIDGIEAGAPVPVPAATGEAPTIDQPSTETLMPTWVGVGSTNDAYFKGVIDEVRAYSGPLDPTGAYLVSREVRNTP